MLKVATALVLVTTLVGCASLSRVVSENTYTTKAERCLGYYNILRLAEIWNVTDRVQEIEASILAVGCPSEEALFESLQ